ncbi:hypothetical protein SAMN04487904_10862 [Actinopolyspora lacussalsi subsp. righensis]|uniref:Alkaline shock response membrane anchor protein AmaP n=1 Tax=Actinopolyspora righensis TaxID=995060 RepID=A0A1I7ATD7_9ACTN|nr:alkaline shock response membrane anchor protein AmaP [Actinopolyspora righensis]SFT78193.1 hypothetical protein SAMN04487904_10862 [Actinopolyspora righensis]
MAVEQSSTPRHTERTANRLGRSLTFERTIVHVVGTLAVLAGALTLLVGSGVLGVYRADRPVLDPLLERWIRDNPRLSLTAVAVLGVLLVLLGLWWLIHALRPENRPDIHIGGGATGTTSLTGTAFTDAVRTDAREVSGVTRARVRTTGTAENPGLRMVLSLQHGTDVRQVWEELDEKVLSRAREALRVETLPTVVRLNLDSSPAQRVR